MMVIFRDTAKEIPMPVRAREIPRFLWKLWTWEVVFFWFLAIDLELLLLLYLWDKMPALQKFKRFETRLLNLVDRAIILQDVMECDIHFGSEAQFLSEMPKSFLRCTKWIGNSILGWALLGEGRLWAWIYKALPKGPLAKIALLRSARVRLAGANILMGADRERKEADE